jgi:hypothetical protein
MTAKKKALKKNVAKQKDARKYKMKLRQMQVSARVNLAKAMDKTRRGTLDGLKEMDKKHKELLRADVKYERTVKEITELMEKKHKIKYERTVKEITELMEKKHKIRQKKVSSKSKKK